MTFKKLIEKHTWPSISSIFLEIYPEAEKNIAGYKMVFEKLKDMDPEDIDISLVIKTETSEDDNYVDVSGLSNNPKTEEEKYSQGIEFTPWRQWLGMHITRKTLEAFSQQEILIHCLYEMTYVGFSEDHILKVIDRSLKSTKDQQPMTEEEQEKIRISVEKILNSREED